MPPLTEAALRVAVADVDTVAAARFERESHAARREAVQTDSTVPLHTFLYRWGVFVALRRYPSRVARLDELERAVGRATAREEARANSSALAALLHEAASEVSG